MKKIFTLIATLMLTTGLFAQPKYVDMVENGHMEEEQSEDWSCFWVHEWRTMDEQTQGFANIVEDPLDSKNHCAKVVVRTEAEADAAENKIKPDGQQSLASWDSQFFIYVRQKIESGKMLRLTMRVRADKNAYIETQAHWEPGNYNHYQLFGNIDVSTEWTKVEKEVVISTDMTQENNDKEMHTVAFNLATMTDGNVFYFDDVKLEIKDQKQSEFLGWFNMLRNTDLTSETINDKVVNGFSYFTGRDAALNQDLPARIVTDPLDGQPALNVTSLEPCRQGTRPVIDEETGDTIGTEPNGTYYQYVERAILDENDQPTGETEWKEEEITDWSTQFFVSQPHKFQLNEKVRFVMWARADKPAQIDSQIHRAPGDYKHYVFLGSFDLTPEWQRFEVETTISDQAQIGGWTVAFNSNKLREANNYYFRIEEFSINEADLVDADRTLGEEEITLPVPAPNESIPVEVDFSTMKNVLSVDNLRELIVGDNMLIADEEGEFGLSTFSAVYEGAIFNLNGAYDENGTITIELDESVSDDNKVTFIISNFGEALGEQTVDSKIGFEKEKWCYAYKVKFVDATLYDDGINELNTSTRTSKAIYDLSGRRVSTPTKGIFIVDGKKFVK